MSRAFTIGMLPALLALAVALAAGCEDCSDKKLRGETCCLDSTVGLSCYETL